MFAWWGRVVVRGRWLVLVATLGIVAVGVIWGTGIFGALASGGFDDPASESSRASSLFTVENRDMTRVSSRPPQRGQLTSAAAANDRTSRLTRRRHALQSYS